MSDLYSLLRRPLFIRLFIWMLPNTPFLLPIKRVRETDSLLAFHHPRPEYLFHVVFVPKKTIHSFADLAPAEPFVVDLIAVTQSLVAEYHLPAYRLIVNGGEYQEFPLLHFHLISESTIHA